MKNLEKKCVNNAETRGPFTAIQKAAVEEREYRDFYESFCVFKRDGLKLGIPSSPPDFTGIPFPGLSNLGVLCSLCGTFENEEDRPAYPLCPSVPMCECRSAMKDGVYTEVFANCPATNAYYDPWHRTMTTLIGCWVGGFTTGEWTEDFSKEADYLVENSAPRSQAIEWLLYWKNVLGARRLEPNLAFDLLDMDQHVKSHLESALQNASSSENPTDSWPWSSSAVGVVSSWMKLGLGADLLKMHAHHPHHRLVTEL